MNLYFYKNRKKILGLGLLLLISGILMAFFYWGIEPQETIAGVFCGFGVSLILLPLSIKKE